MMILMMIEDMLADLGCESIIAAATAEHAIGLIEGQVFDAAMLDLNLNGQESYAVADALIARSVPFVFCTGATDRHMRDGYRNHPVVKKPFSDDRLTQVLARLLSR